MYVVGNVLKEICEPEGAVIQASRFKLGDPTLTVLELWGAEYQESNAALVRNSDTTLLQQLSTREKCDVSFVGKITGDGKVWQNALSISILPNRIVYGNLDPLLTSCFIHKCRNTESFQEKLQSYKHYKAFTPYLLSL